MEKFAQSAVTKKSLLINDAFGGVTSQAFGPGGGECPVE